MLSCVGFGRFEGDVNMWRWREMIVGCGFAVTEGKGFCRRRQERRAQEQLKGDLASLDRIVIIESKGKRRKR